MQGLVNYAASPTPSPPPSTKRGEQVTQPSSKVYQAEASSSSAVKPPRKTPTGIRKLPKSAQSIPAKTETPPPQSSAALNTSSKRRRISPSPSRSSSRSKIASADLPQNLTHTAQSALPTSILASEPITIAEEVGEAEGWPGYPGLSDDEVFKIVSRPREMPGVDDWGIPAEVDPVESSEALKAKVTSFLKLKQERGEHINTRLLSSAAFANPYIYSKLVDFVQISEHASQFPNSGWLTRRNIEAEVPIYGPAALAIQQKAKQDATKKAQEVGKRKEISFKSGREADSIGTGSHSGTGGKWDSGRVSDGRDRDRDRHIGNGGVRRKG